MPSESGEVVREAEDVEMGGRATILSLLLPGTGSRWDRGMGICSDGFIVDHD